MSRHTRRISIPDKMLPPSSEKPHCGQFGVAFYNWVGKKTCKSSVVAARRACLLSLVACSQTGFASSCPDTLEHFLYWFAGKTKDRTTNEPRYRLLFKLFAATEVKKFWRVTRSFHALGKSTQKVTGISHA